MLSKPKDDQISPILANMSNQTACFVTSYSFSLVWSFLLLGKIKMANCLELLNSLAGSRAKPYFLLLSSRALNTCPNPVIHFNTLFLKFPIIPHGMFAPTLQQATNSTFQIQGMFPGLWLQCADILIMSSPHVIIFLLYSTDLSL